MEAGWPSGSGEGGAVFTVLLAETEFTEPDTEATTEAATETAVAQPGARNVTVTPAAEGGIGNLVVRVGGTTAAAAGTAAEGGVGSLASGAGAHTRSPPRPEEGSCFRPRLKAALSASESSLHICPIAFSLSVPFMLVGRSGLCVRLNSW